MIKSLSEFKQAKVQTEENPDTFWSEIASEFHGNPLGNKPLTMTFQYQKSNGL